MWRLPDGDSQAAVNPRYSTVADWVASHHGSYNYTLVSNLIMLVACQAAKQCHTASFRPHDGCATWRYKKVCDVHRRFLKRLGLCAAVLEQQRARSAASSAFVPQGRQEIRSRA